MKCTTYRLIGVCVLLAVLSQAGTVLAADPTTQGAPPETPQIVSVVVSANPGVTKSAYVGPGSQKAWELEIASKATGQDGVFISRRVVSDNSNTVTVSTATGVFKGSLIGKSGVVPGKLYYYRVRQQSSADSWSAWSAWYPAGAFILLNNANKPASVPGKILYADNTLAANITNGTYSAQNRGPGGTDGNAYKTIQEAVYTMNAGDMLLLRGGTFKESNISLGKTKSGPWWVGTADAWYEIRSYPGEWAIVDGEHKETVDSNGKPVLAYNLFYSRQNLAFVRLSYFEACNGGPGVKNPDGSDRTGMYDANVNIPGFSCSGFFFWTGHDVIFDRMAIHDNYGGASNLGGNGISIQNNETGTARNILVDHCWIYRNGWPDGKSGIGVRLFADYKHDTPSTINLDVCMQKNEVRYSRMEKMTHAVYHKAQQDICLTSGDDIHAGTNMAAKDKGDSLHHNVVSDCVDGIAVLQDFVQLHHNAIRNCGTGIIVGRPPGSTWREPFYVTMYNNSIVNCTTAGLCLYRGWDGITSANYTPTAAGCHPYLYVWNNILDHTGTTGPGGGPIRILPQYDSRADAPMNMATIQVDNDLVVGTAVGLNAIRMGRISYTMAGYAANGWATSMWDVATSPLQGGTGSAAFLPKAGYTVGGKTLDQAGRGGNHPYLEDVTIPSYLGAVDPANSGWVAEVENLNGLGTTIKAPMPQN